MLMSIKLKEYKVNIVPKNDCFHDDMITFLKRKSVFFKRESALAEIFENKKDVLQLQKVSPIFLDGVHGCTYQSDFRDNKDIFAISHEIISIGFDTDGFYGIISETNYGDLIDFDRVVLRPVYYKNKEGEYLIATFDIDFNRIKDVA
jgi:hypothetical protein